MADAALRAAPSGTNAGGGGGWLAQQHLWRWAAARFRMGTAGDAPPGRRPLKDIPAVVLQALTKNVASIWAGMPPSVAGLFAAKAANKGRWWMYVPFLLHVLARGVQRPSALVPGTRAALDGHGTLVPDTMLRQLRTVAAATGAVVRGRPSLEACPQLAKDSAAVPAAGKGPRGRAGCHGRRRRCPQPRILGLFYRRRGRHC